MGITPFMEQVLIKFLISKLMFYPIIKRSTCSYFKLVP
jgi:hypothetical protein